MKAAYVDASALVKLFKAERETEALRRSLKDWPVQASSELIRVEAICTARRLDDDRVLRLAREAVELIDLIPLSPQTVELAASVDVPPLRAMDALHLATALTMQDDLGAFFVYDHDLHAAAKATGLNPLAPE